MMSIFFFLENEIRSPAPFFFCSFSQELWRRLIRLFGLVPPSVRHYGSGRSCQMERARSRCRLGSRSHPVSFQGDCFPCVASVTPCLLLASFTNARKAPGAWNAHGLILIPEVHIALIDFWPPNNIIRCVHACRGWSGGRYMVLWSIMGL